MPTLDILGPLVSFPTVSTTSNMELIGYVTGLFDAAGIAWERVDSPDGSRANLFATVGPADRPGVVLSGHSDVVPAAGQTWSRDPFRLHVENGRCYGRGTADMKGFVASAVAACLRAADRRLTTPLHLALSYDEEVGCLGVRRLLEALGPRRPRPAVCIVGEPTGMAIATGHKGKRAFRATCTGHAVHSALAPDGLNALYLAADVLGVLRREQAAIARSGLRDAAYGTPFTTIHAGVMRGGEVLNIVPDRCEVDFEVRYLAGDEPEAMLARIAAGAEAIVAPVRDAFPEAAIEIEQRNAYPGLETAADSPAVELVRSLVPEAGAPLKVAFGTEAGLFVEALGVPTVICGPGYMAQGHRPDEFVETQQLDACDKMMDRLLDRLEAGL
jgi:acetylornithine deacetylase